MLKRVWATVSDRDFYACIERAREEGIDLGEVLARLVNGYAQGNIKLKRRREHDKPQTGVDYRAKKLAEVEGGMHAKQVR